MCKSIQERRTDLYLFVRLLQNINIYFPQSLYVLAQSAQDYSSMAHGAFMHSERRTENVKQAFNHLTHIHSKINGARFTKHLKKGFRRPNPMKAPSRHEDFGRWSCLANEPNLTLGNNETQE